MSNVVVNSTTYQNIDYLRVLTSDGDVAQAPIIAETDEGITLLKYLDTDSCAIDLGRKLTYPSTGSSLQMRFGILDTTSTQILFSSGTTGSYCVDQLVIYNSRLRMDRENSGGDGRISLSVGDDIVYSSFTKTENNSWSYVFNLSTGASYGATEKTAMYDIADPTYNMLLFAEHNNINPYQTFANIRFYEFCYKESGVDVIHLYPAIDGNDMKCLYDSVSKTCIYPATGSFA